ncbi:MAG: hypothetical protein ABSC48_02885 [Terracidiphilus sp.]
MSDVQVIEAPRDKHTHYTVDELVVRVKTDEKLARYIITRWIQGFKPFPVS